MSTDDTPHRTSYGGIAILPFEEIEKEVLTPLADELSVIFKKKIYTCPPLEKPSFAYNSRRKQYLSTSILHVVLSHHEYASFERMLGVVDVDLYVPELNFVFGIASGRGALISLARLAPEWYGHPKDRELFRRRVSTEAVHELGHTFGLTHCANPRCVMFFSNSLQDTDRKGSKFCKRCERIMNVIRRVD